MLVHIFHLVSFGHMNAKSTVLSYRDLFAWQKAIELSVVIYKDTQEFPKVERYGLISQMRRAAASIPANIAEGNARNPTGEYRQHLGIASGSLAELETFITISNRIGYLTEARTKHLQAQCAEVGKLINGILRSLR